MFLLRTGRRVRRGSIANGGQQIGGDRNKTGVRGNSRFPQSPGIAASKFLSLPGGKFHFPYLPDIRECNF